MSEVAGKVVVNYQDGSKRIVNVAESFFVHPENLPKHLYVSPQEKAISLALLGKKPYKVTITRGNKEQLPHVFHENVPKDEELTHASILRSDEKVLKKELRSKWKKIPWMGKAIISLPQIKDFAH